MPGEQIALVTGARAGTALGLARTGFRVIMAGRDGARTEQACRTVAERSGSTLVEPALADLASLAAVRRLADRVLAADDRRDLLVNNAGLIAPRFQLYGDGYELTIAVDHLAPFLLTNLLLDGLRASARMDNSGARIVTVASQLCSESLRACGAPERNPAPTWRHRHRQRCRGFGAWRMQLPHGYRHRAAAAIWPAWSAW